MVNKKPGVLIVDAEQVVCDVLHDELSEQGYLCTTVLSGNDALAKLATQDFDVVLLDIKLPGISGIEVLRKMQSNYSNTAAIVITGINDVDVAVATIKLGASDYIVKPFDLDRINTSIRTALETKKRLPGRRECEILHWVGDEEEDKPVMEEFSNEMNAIAHGVEVKLDLLFTYSEKVTRRTIDIARQLGIAEEKIQKWAAARARLESKRNRAITSSLDKLKESPLAQCVMGMTKLYQPTAKSNESQN